MQFHKWLKEKHSSTRSNTKSSLISSVNNQSRKQESRRKTVKIDEKPNGKQLVIMYLASHTLLPTMLAILRSFNENEAKVSQLFYDNFSN